MSGNTFKQNIVALFVIGVLAAGIGALIMISAWPETIVTPGYTSAFSSALDIEEEVVTTGSSFGVFVGAMLALTGQIMLAVATIGCGVRLGNQSRANATA